MIIENVPLAARSFAIILAKDAIAKERNAIFVQQPNRAGLSSSHAFFVVRCSFKKMKTDEVSRHGKTDGMHLQNSEYMFNGAVCRNVLLLRFIYQHSTELLFD